jgi:hypothetical protein
MIITSKKGYSVTLNTTEDEYQIECSYQDKSYNLSIKRSKVKLEWNIATNPLMYRSKSRKLIVLQNMHCFDFDTDEYYKITKSYQKEQLTDKLLEFYFRKKKSLNFLLPSPKKL